MQSDQQVTTNGHLNLEEIRYRYLGYLVQHTGGDSSREVPVLEVTKALGITEEEGDNASGFLRRKAFTSGTYTHDCLTAAGMDEYQRLSSPTVTSGSGAVSYHYGDNNHFTNQGGMTDSNVMLGSHGSTQQLSVGVELAADTLHSIAEIVRSVREALPELSLEEHQREAAEASLSDLEKETKAPTPNRKTMRVYVTTLVSLLQGAAGSVLAQPIIHQLQQVLPALMGTPS